MILGSTNAKSLMFLALDTERLSIRGQMLLFRVMYELKGEDKKKNRLFEL